MDEVSSADRHFLLGLVSQVDPAAALVAVRGPDGTIVDFRYLEVNQEACEFLGLSREALLTRSFLQLFPQHRNSALLAAFAGVVDTGVPLRWNDVEIASAVRPPGTRFDLRGVLIRRLLVLSWRDNTERAAAAAQLRRSEARMKSLMEHSSDAVLEATPDGTITWASDSTKANFGWAPDELVGVRVFSLLHPDDLAANEGLIARVRAGEHVTMRARLRTGSGNYRWVSSQVTPAVDDDGHVLTVTAGWRDVHDEQLAVDALTEANRRLRELVDNSSDAVAEGDNDGVITWLSESVQALTGWRPEQLVGRPFADYVHPEDRPLVASTQAKALAGIPSTMAARFRTALGDHRWISFQVRPTRNAAGAVTGRIIGWRNVHAEHEHRTALAESEERFRAAMHAAPIGMAVLDMEHRMIAVNPALCRLVGQLGSWLLVRHLAEVIDPRDRRLDVQARATLLESGDPSTSVEMRLVHRDGHVIWVQHVIAALRDEQHRPTGWVSQFLDVTTAVQTRERLTFQATHDALTHVGNRAQLRDSISVLLTEPTPKERSSGVLFVDVDNLKQINDLFGHDVGDEVLIGVAGQITACTRADDVTVRYGGDEFVVIVNSVGTVDQLVAIAHKIREAVALRAAAGRAGVAVTVSIGATMASPSTTPETTLRQADDALYRAKRAGRNRVEAFVTGRPADRSGDRPAEDQPPLA